MEGKKSLMKLKRMIVKLKWSMKLLQPIPSTTLVVPKGHFAVLAGEERFVFGFEVLRNPAIVNLLNEAEEEFGFQHEGALVVLVSLKSYR
ncbi:Auxin-responsive protein SAUR50 [Bienertia sinuspersici]